jgi:ribonucleoside-diphosphate reductase beta chain
MPLMRAIAVEGRAEETLFLTTFISDEAHHAEFFRTWFDEVAHLESVEDYLTDAHRRVFDEELPRAMGRLENDHSGEAFLDAALTYNHFVEGVLAMTGYWAWGRLFAMQDIFPGMKRGIELIQRDERRHLAYGTYLCRRIVAEDPATWAFVERRMEELRGLGLEFLQDTADMAFGQVVKSTNMSVEEAEGMKVIADAVATEFQQFGERALERRLAVIEVARGSTLADVEIGTVEEEVEEAIEHS